MTATSEQGVSGQRSLAYFLLLMFLVSALNMADRQIIGVVAEPIKREFQVSDTMIGLLSGTAFAIAYPPLGLPIARLADRLNRRNILAACLGLWSVMAMLCGAAGGFWSLVAARTGVAAGEAGYAPCSHALIADSVSERRRSGAFAILVTGISAGVLIATVGGGYVAQHYGWRWAFVMLGLPGLVVAGLVRWTIREPVRKARVSASTAWSVYRRLGATPAFAWCVAGSAFHLIVAYGLAAWAIVWFVRGYGMDLARAALVLGALGAAAGAAGSLIGGYTGDRLSRIDRRWLGWWPSVTVLVAGLIGVPAFLSHDFAFAVAATALAVFFNALYQPASYALIQGIARADERASAAALMIFIQNFVGLGLGPLLIGLASDLYTPAFGDRALGIAIATIFGFNGLSAFAFYRAGKALPDALSPPHEGELT